MAIIYDLATGKVISEHEAVKASRNFRREPCPGASLQQLDAVRAPETDNPCDAYMVLLQRLLKDL